MNRSPLCTRGACELRFPHIEISRVPNTEIHIGIPDSGDPGAFTDILASLATIWGNNVFTGGDLNTWEESTADLLLPFGTDYLAIQLRAAEDIFNNFIFPEFDGHYADKVSVTLSGVPLPAAVWLFGFGLLGLVGMFGRGKAA